MTDKEFNVALEDLLKEIPPEFSGLIASYSWRAGKDASYERVIEVASELTRELKLSLSRFVSRLSREHRAQG